MKIGIEAMNAYSGQAYLDVKDLFKARKLDLIRFENLMMKKKSVSLPCEDPVTYAVNAGMPIIKHLSNEEKNSIELLIVSTESGLDFGKSLSTYVHDYLGLKRQCKLFEVKQACYGGTAAFQTAAQFIASGVSPGAKALVIATDTARYASKLDYAEPSQGAAALAILVSDQPKILELDFGAGGYYSYEVMDSCRPNADIETGDPDLSLLSYLDCLEGSFRDYSEKVENVDFQETFDFLAFHTPFAGMVKGAHRQMMRKFKKADPDEVESDFLKRVDPSLKFCMEIGNVYSAAVYLALSSLIYNTQLEGPKRVGLFSYGSGCSSEFYSGVISPQSKESIKQMDMEEQFNSRYDLSIPEYDRLLDLNKEYGMGVKDIIVDFLPFADIFEKQLQGKGKLVLKDIKHYHRSYEWS